MKLNLKKRVLLLIFVVLMIPAFHLTVYAEPITKRAIVNTKLLDEITDLSFYQTAEIVEVDDRSVTLTSYRETSIPFINRIGEVEKEVEATTAVIVLNQEIEDAKDNIVNFAGKMKNASIISPCDWDGEITDKKTDQSYSGKVWVTVSWKVVEKPKSNYIYLKKATGGTDIQLSLYRGGTGEIGQNGVYDGGYASNQTLTTGVSWSTATSKNGWSLTRPSSWKQVVYNNTHTVGGSFTVKIGRDSTWSCSARVRIK